MTFRQRLAHYCGTTNAANGLSLAVAGLSLLFLHLESSPIPAGGDVARRPSIKPNLMLAAAPVSSTANEMAAADEGTLDPQQRRETILLEKIHLLEKGLEFLKKTPDYTAQFVKQELVAGELLAEQEMEMKVRHQPFSIYLKWVTGEVGREVLFVDGMNDGRMTAHGGGWKARLPAVNLELNSNMALAESRHPISEAGLLQLTQMMLDTHKADLETGRVGHCEKLPEQLFDGRPCLGFVIEYASRDASDLYRKSISLIDKEWSIPVYTRHFGWLDGEAPASTEDHDNATLVEFYSYASIKFRPNLLALDFDATNEDYRFKRQ